MYADSGVSLWRGGTLLPCYALRTFFMSLGMIHIAKDMHTYTYIGVMAEAAKNRLRNVTA